MFGRRKKNDSVNDGGAAEQVVENEHGDEQNDADQLDDATPAE